MWPEENERQLAFGRGVECVRMMREQDREEIGAALLEKRVHGLRDGGVAIFARARPA